VGLKRGDIVIVALRGDLGKPRPAVVLETDRLAPTEHVLVCPGTSIVLKGVEPRRVLVLPSPNNGLRLPTQFQADKVNPARRASCGTVIGRLEDEAMAQIEGLLAVLLGLAE
jgi:mRNA interferase MazF